MSEAKSVSKRRNDEIWIHVALRDTLQADTIFKILAICNGYARQTRQVGHATQRFFLNLMEGGGVEKCVTKRGNAYDASLYY